MNSFNKEKKWIKVVFTAIDFGLWYCIYMQQFEGRESKFRFWNRFWTSKYFVVDFVVIVIVYFVLVLAEKYFDPSVCCMIPFYLLYTSFVPMHAKFATTLYRIGLRYRCLNKVITAYAAPGECEGIIAYTIWILFSCFCSVYAACKNGFFKCSHRQAEVTFLRLKQIYDSLGTVLQYVSRYFKSNLLFPILYDFFFFKFSCSEFGITIIILLLECLFHLIISLYHVLVAVLGEQVNFKDVCAFFIFASSN